MSRLKRGGRGVHQTPRTASEGLRELVPPLMRKPTVVMLTSPLSSPRLQVQMEELVSLRVIFLEWVSTITTGSLVEKLIAVSSAQHVSSASAAGCDWGFTHLNIVETLE